MTAGMQKIGMALWAETENRSIRDQLSIIVISAEEARLHLAFTLACRAAEMGLQASMLFSLNGLQAIQSNDSWHGRDLPEIAPIRKDRRSLLDGRRSLDAADGCKKFLQLSKSKGAGELPQICVLETPFQVNWILCLPDLYSLAVDYGVQMIPCQATLEQSGDAPTRLKSNCAPAISPADFLQEARKSKITLFI